MRNHTRLFGAIAGFLLALAASGAHAQAREEGRLLMATEVLEELRATRDQYIPDLLLERAYGIAVIPNVTKLALIAGGRRGKGVLVVRDANGRFTQPIFVNLTGGSVGFQWGVQSTDVVLVFTTKRSVEGIADGKVTLGADASVAAGPVGRQASAATDTSFTAEVYSYSRSSGIFAGVALDGTALTIDHRSNARFYGKNGVTATEILNGAVTSNVEATRRFLQAVTTSTGSAGASTSSADNTVPATGATPATAQPVSTQSGDSGVRTFPMEDTQPGQEPPR